MKRFLFLCVISLCAALLPSLAQAQVAVIANPNVPFYGSIVG